MNAYFFASSDGAFFELILAPNEESAKEVLAKVEADPELLEGCDLAATINSIGEGEARAVALVSAHCPIDIKLV